MNATRRKNTVGQTYNGVLILSESDKRQCGDRMFLCQCHCGEEFYSQLCQITSGVRIGCGCSAFIDITGKVIGGVTALERTDKRKNGCMVWKCLCSCCGQIVELSTAQLQRKDRKSCGCYRMTGENHPRYNPAIREPGYQERHRSQTERREFSKIVFDRDNYKCVICNSKKKLNAHHLNGYHWCVEGRTDINNGITLCNIHHKKFHKEYSNVNNTREQFIEFYLSHSYSYNV